MTRVRTLVKILAGATLTVAALVAVAGPALAYEGTQPTFATSDVFFHCIGDTKLQNVNWLETLGDGTSYAPWDANAPNKSVTDGAGCGGFDVGWTTNEVYDPIFQGTFTGNLRDLTVRIHELLFGNTRQSATQPMRVYADIDGVPIFPHGTTAGAYDGRGFTVTSQAENDGATALVEFTITNIGYANYVYDDAGNLVDVQTGGAALENGDGTQEHTLTLMLGADSFIGDDPPTGTDMWVWDTTEVASGLTFNPTEPAAATVAADLPDFGG